MERNARYVKWMQECFFFDATPEEITALEAMTVMTVRFFNFYDNMEMEIVCKSKEGKLEIRCDSIEVLGEVIQDLMEYVGAK